jgi:hypothetical protein
MGDDCVTKVMCGDVMCKFNTSTVAGKSGECTKKAINFEYKNFEHYNADEETEYLDCTDFEWDNCKVVADKDGDK